MSYELYSIFDKVAGFYSAPSCYQFKELALRDLKYLVNHDDKMSSMASDLTIYCLGTFDSESGQIARFNEPKFVCNMTDLIVKE